MGVVVNFLDERLPPRFWRKVQPCPMSGCWLWSAFCGRWGYGTFKVCRDGRKTSTLAHRTSYEALVGQVQEGLQLDHLCRTPCCVNPAHLEPVTARVNTLRSDGVTAINARKTHCLRGHEFTAANTYRWRGGRKCLTCNRDLQARIRTTRSAVAS